MYMSLNTIKTPQDALQYRAAAARCRSHYSIARLVLSRQCEMEHRGPGLAGQDDGYRSGQPRPDSTVGESVRRVLVEAITRFKISRINTKHAEGIISILCPPHLLNELAYVVKPFLRFGMSTPKSPARPLGCVET